MDMGGLFEAILLLLIARIAAALFLDLGAGIVGARHGRKEPWSPTAVVTGILVGAAVSLAAGLASLDYGIHWLGVAYILGPVLAYGTARGLAFLFPPWVR